LAPRLPLGDREMARTQKFPVGTTFHSSGKHPRVCTVTDYWVTSNLAGDIVRTSYVATHEFCGQTVAETDILEISIAKRLIATP